MHGLKSSVTRDRLIMFKRKSNATAKVPVTSGIGWRPYQQHLTVRDITIRVLLPELHVLKYTTPVDFTITGSLSPHFHGESRWRPFIEELHISERFAHENDRLIADILIVPVVGIRCDKRYDNQPVEFEVTARHPISTYKWNRNHYRVTCEQLTRTFQIIQFNKDGQLREDDDV